VRPEAVHCGCERGHHIPAGQRTGRVRGRLLPMKRFAGIPFVAAFSLLSIGSIFPPEEPDPRERIEPPPWEEASDLPLTIGRGWEDFRAYTEGQALPVTSGFQGGTHVHTTLLSAAFTPADSVARVLTWFVDPADETVLDGAYETDGLLEPLPEELIEAGFGDVGAPFALAFLEEVALLDREVELRVHVEFDDGRISRASARGVLELEWDSPDWDQWLCRHESGGDCLDAGPSEGGPLDAGLVDAGLIDAGLIDAGLIDAGLIDAGLIDAGAVDAGASDAGTVDAGASDAGTSDAG